MTEKIEWFMIRFFGMPSEFVRWELDWLDKDGRRDYHPHTGDMSMIEPAPPKDWRPYCFSESPLGVCGGAIDIDSLGYLGNRCKKCPYRKME